MADERAGDDEWVLMPVQRRYLSVVNNAIHEAWVEESLASAASSANQAPRGGWNKTEIGKLKKAVRNPTVRALLDLTATRSDQWVTYDDLCVTVGRDWAEVRGDLAGFTQLLRKKFSREGRDKWPVEVEWKTEKTPTRYRMPLYMARWWNEARSQAVPRNQRI
jgi:hypothetical protein